MRHNQTVDEPLEPLAASGVLVGGGLVGGCVQCSLSLYSLCSQYSLCSPCSLYAKSTYCAHRLTVLAKLSTTHTRCVRRGLSLSLSLSVTEGSQAISHILYTVVRNRRRLGWSALPARVWSVVELFFMAYGVVYW